MFFFILMRVVLKFTLSASPSSSVSLYLTSQILCSCPLVIFTAVLCTFTKVLTVLLNIGVQPGTEHLNKQQCQRSKKTASQLLPDLHLLTRTISQQDFCDSSQRSCGSLGPSVLLLIYTQIEICICDFPLETL